MQHTFTVPDERGPLHGVIDGDAPNGAVAGLGAALVLGVLVLPVGEAAVGVDHERAREAREAVDLERLREEEQQERERKAGRGRFRGSSETHFFQEFFFAALI